MRDAAAAKRWLGLAVLSLVLAGTLSLLLVVGRLPVLSEVFTDPLFFRRCLVVHVDLALVVWFYSFLAALFSLVPTRRPAGFLSRAGSAIAAGGVLLLIASAGIPGAEPVLANYVPVVDAPSYAIGLVLFAAGVAATFASRRLLPRDEAPAGFFAIPSSARVGLRAGGIAFLIACLTFAASVLVTSRSLPADAYYELVAWGGGHVLQFASVAGMLAAWSILLSHALGHDPIDRRVAAVLFAVLIAPLAIAPAAALTGTSSASAREVFTDLMRWGIFPVVLTYLALCIRAIVRARASLRDPRVLAFATSAALTVTGFAIGAMIRGPNTVVPAHYHASIGAVTVAYMAVAYPLLVALRMQLPTGRAAKLVALQPAIFGVGQVVFAIGFGMAGSQGMARKVYGAEQHVRTLTETIGLGVMGIGGVAAIVGGVFFLWVVVRAWLARAPKTAPQEGGIGWNPGSIQSRG